ncbi:MAG: 50S ribosomal protein L19 [Planctomycetes bacterium]|nr:50S ribosomal protein L19 [Planctomycetota bacterium]
MNPIIMELEKEHAKKSFDDFTVGDTVDVHVRIIEGEKERIQIFNGVVIARNKGGINENFTVRRLVQGEGVERVFPIHAPRVEKIEIKRRGRTKRAKLYYLRDRVGKATRLKEEVRPSRGIAKGKKA